MVRKRTFQTARRTSDGGSGPDSDRQKGSKHSYHHFKDDEDDTAGQRHSQELRKQLREGLDQESFEKFRTSDEKLKEIKNKPIREFYASQNEKLDDWLEVDTIVRAMADDVMESMNPDPDNDARQEGGGRLQNVQGSVEEMLPDDVRTSRQKAKRNAKWAININVIANILILIIKGVAALQSNSLSLIASLLDSALDLLCTAIIWTTDRLVTWRMDSLKRKFPVGRRRLEPLGILVFSIIMVISFAQVLQESVQRLLPSGDHSIASLPAIAIGAIASNVVIKGLIGLACMKIKTSQVQALVQDCKTDVYFNTLSLLFPLIGKHAGIWWLDPAGATVLSLYVIYDWGDTSFATMIRLCGSAADNRINKKLTYLAFRFSPLVAGFKTITAYHMGDNVWAEFDLLLDEKSSLRDVHDISETLQYCAEALPEVDRAFVTIDYSAQNPGGHATDNA